MAKKTKEKKKNGRPTIFTPELTALICERIGTGKSLRTVLKEKNMPHMSSVFKWLSENEGFSEQYARACIERTEAHSEALLDMGDEAIVLVRSTDGKKANAMVSAVKLKADNLKWSMSKMQPKKYGDKLDLTSGNKALKGNTIVFKDFRNPDGAGG